MKRGRGRLAFPVPAALAALALVALATGRARGSEPADPLAAEIERWSTYLRSNTSTDEIWTQVKQGAQPALEGAGAALRDGRRLFALTRLAAARDYLSASLYLGERTDAQRKDMAAFEAEWSRMGQVLREELGAPAPTALDGVRPAAVRALGEAALPQVRTYYDASLEYGRNTMPASGLFYLGEAQAAREFAALCKTLARPSTSRPPALRALGPELDALQGEVLAAYRPPASIDKHREFIVANATLKEARELDAAGLRYGALLRYLQAALRFAPLRPASPALDADTLKTRLAELAARLAAQGEDSSLGQLFVETAEADLASQTAGAATATAIVSDVLPRYFAALQPASPAAPRPAPQVTVTLVRWPYT